MRDRSNSASGSCKPWSDPMKVVSMMFHRKNTSVLIYAALVPAMFMSGCGEQATESAPIVRPVKILEIGALGAGSIRE